MASDARDINGRVAIVTGGGRGVGAATSALLAARGARVVVLDISGEAANETAVAIRAAGGEAIAVVTDISSEQQVADAYRATVEAFGGIDILFNNAAALQLVKDDNLAAEIDVVNWRATFDVNITGVMLMTREALRLMIPKSAGSIVNCSSASSLGGEFGLTAYGASKAAVNQFTRAVATQYGRSGIRCNAVAPGLIQSGAGRVDEKRLEKYRRHHVTPRLGETDDIAEMVAFLASDAAAFVTGQIIAVDGGATAHLSWAAEDLPSPRG